MLTGRIDVWHAQARHGRPRARSDLLTLVHRDLQKVYPNRHALEPLISDLTFADWGEFILNQRIPSWER